MLSEIGLLGGLAEYSKLKTYCYVSQRENSIKMNL